jgi:3-phenylpropionate/trans-cinnamate dioxygenase ferredoxin subunit
MAKAHHIAKTKDIEDEAGKAFKIGDLEIAVWKTGGKFYATDDICTHAYASLADGYVEDGCVECPLHAGRFEIATGKAMGAPVFTDIKTYPLRVEGEDIIVEIPDA